MQRQLIRTVWQINLRARFLNSERGSVTAELAMALPAVGLVIAITLGGFALQIERIKLVEVAAVAARAIARGETEDATREIAAQLTNPQQAKLLNLSFEYRENVVCVTLARQFELPGLGAQLFDVAENQCARKMGL